MVVALFGVVLLWMIFAVSIVMMKSMRQAPKLTAWFSGSIFATAFFSTVFVAASALP